MPPPQPQRPDHAPATKRPLKVYAFDPTQGRSLGNFMTIEVPYEDLQPGPLGNSLAIVDYDATNHCYYEPVDLNCAEVLLQGGLAPSESDPRFHQQMAYAVAMETIRRFELALGRRIRWRVAAGQPHDSSAPDQLRIFPHAIQEANAYYSRELRALVFGYFAAVENDAGNNLPGQTVFTCLAHDIVAHETAHALVDSQRDFFTEPTSQDAPAFHEAFADIVALFQHFSYKEALYELIQQTGGRIFHPQVAPLVQPTATGPSIIPELTTDNPLVGLAQQFGEAMGNRKALRSALGTPPNTRQLGRTFEPHARGAILVAAVFDAFFTIYVRDTEDLLHIGGATATSTTLHPALADRLAEAVAKHAGRFLNICVRALDYCPPVDIRFGDYLRALVTADYDLVPDDALGYRAAIIDAFRARGIVPERVASYSEDAIRWCPPEVLRDQPMDPVMGLGYDVFQWGDHEYKRDRQRENAKALYAYAVANADLLGLSADVPIQARSFHEVHRVGPDGNIAFGLVAELTQARSVPVDAADPAGERFTFRGGTTIVIDDRGNIRYAIQKAIGQERDDATNLRLAEQRAYLAALTESLSGLALTSAGALKSGLDFRAVHRGY